MQAALRSLNQLVADKVIDQYAIGGAIGASFYVEAVQTEDIDAFVFLKASPSGLISLTPIYDALVASGGSIDREYVRFAEWPVQILPDANDLVRESIRMANEVEYDGIPSRVFTAAHLCAVALQTGRTKDYLRVAMFLEQREIDLEQLETIVERYGLVDRLSKAESFIQGT
ncbi:MAG: hypothetical protein LH481_08605 [Burkholderiales bacterium]|nr:hypothetical protein [Burkholderiales bacterium]